jgi:putative ABC transport system permease protein
VDTADANRRSEYLTVFCRLRSDVTPASAALEMSAIARRLAEQYPATNASWTALEVLPLKEYQIGDVRQALLVFSAAVGLVLLIACANVANLLLARAAAREREIAVRVALGAGRGRLVRQLLTESTLLAVGGGLLGLAIAAWSVDAFRNAASGMLPRLDEVRVDGAVVAFSLLLAVGTGLGFGLVPALRATANVHDSLRQGARGTAAGVARLLNGLVLAEVALAMVLLVGAGLLLRSFDRLTRIDPGFRAEGLLTYSLVLPPAMYPDTRALPQLYEQLRERSGAIPGVSLAAVTSALPIDGAGYLSFLVEGRTPSPTVGEDVQPFTVGPEHFAALGIPLRHGRLLAPSDDATAPRVAVVNEEFARRYLAEREPLGARVTFGGTDSLGNPLWMTVVGVVGNVAQERLTSEPYPQLYQPLAQRPQRFVYVVLRTAGDPLALAADARRTLAEVVPGLPLKDLRTMEDRVSADIAQPRISVVVLALFAALAMTLAAVGLYGVLSYAVTLRTREIGIRLALGAESRDVLRLVVGQGMRPALLGIAAGVGGAFALTRLMRGLLYGVGAADPVTFGAVALFLAAVAFGATWLPARRAARLDPLPALRSE